MIFLHICTQYFKELGQLLEDCIFVHMRNFFSLQRRGHGPSGPMVNTPLTVSLLQGGINMAAIWFSHIAVICIPHIRHLALPYACCMDTIQKVYGLSICLLYGIHTSDIWQSHMLAMWYQYGSYIWLNHIAAILIPHCRCI